MGLRDATQYYHVPQYLAGGGWGMGEGGEGEPGGRKRTGWGGECGGVGTGPGRREPPAPRPNPGLPCRQRTDGLAPSCPYLPTGLHTGSVFQLGWALSLIIKATPSRRLSCWL